MTGSSSYRAPSRPRRHLHDSTSTPARRSTKWRRRAAPMWPCASSPRPRTPRETGDVAVPARGGRHFFSDPAAESPLLRLPPAPLPSMSRLGSFLWLPAFRLPPLPLVCFPPPPESGRAPTCRPPARFPVPAFFILRAGAGGVGWASLFLDQGEKAGK